MCIVHFKMKLDFKLCLLFLACFGSNFGQRVTFIGSYFVSPNENYKSVVLTNGLKSSRVEGSLEGLNKINFPISSQEKFNYVNVKAPKEGSDGIKLEMKADKCTQKSVKLISTSDKSIIFVHFDKPVYKTGEEFKFRIFVLNNNLRPHQNHENIEVLIFDSKENPIKLFNKIRASSFGIFEDSIKLAEAPNLGQWKIRAFIGDKKISKSFFVYKPDENGLEVAVDAPSAIAHIDKRLYITVHVKDNIDKFFVGTADIFVKAKFKNANKNQLEQHVKTVDINGNKKVIPVDFDNDIGIRFPTADMILDFDIVVKDQATQRSFTVNKQIELIYKGKNTIQVVRKKYFKPNYRFNARVKVKLLDGRPDNSFNQLSVAVKYIDKNSKAINEQSQINLKNGETLLSLQPKADTIRIVLDLKFAGVEHSEKIDRFPGIEEYMQVSPTNKISKSSSKATFAVKASEEMERLHVVVVGTKGVVFSQDFPDSIGKDVVNFEVPLSDDMKPEARGLAFYSRNGEMVYDEFSISTRFSVDNDLEITSPETAKPNEVINYDVKTERGSKVYITAVDQNPTSLTMNNEISRSEIYNELVYYLNFKFPNASKYHFEKFNGFVFEPVMDGKCNDKALRSDRVESSNEDGMNAVNIPTNYFPEIMINDNYDATSSNAEKRSIKIPESQTRWQLFGVSVHPDIGLTVTKVQSKITVKKELAVQVRAPTSAYDTEAFTVDVRAFNPLNDPVNVQGTIKVENGFIVDKTSKTEFGLKCDILSSSGARQKQLSWTLSPEQISNPVSFLIQPNGHGNVVIKVSVSRGGNKDDVEKIIEIRKPGSDSNENVNSRIYGSLLDPGLNGLETMFDRPMVTDEEKMLKFGMAITNYKFLTKINKLNDEIAKKALNDIIAGYQEAIVILENILPELNSRQQMDMKFTWLVSMTAQNLIDARTITSIDEDLIIRSLNVIKSQQDRNGKFKYDENADYHRNIGDKFRQEIQSALIIAAFLKNKSTTQIQKTIDFLKTNARSWSSYPKSIAAYSLALSGDTATAKSLLRNINSVSYADANSESIETASYIILTTVLLQEDPQDEVKWLLSQRSSDGSFYSPFDTVLAHQALYEYSISKNMRTQGLQSVKRTRQDDIDGFWVSIAEEFGKSNEVKISLKIVNNGTEFDKTNLAVVEVEFPRGYRYTGYDAQNDNIEKVSVQNDRSRVLLYINKFERNRAFTLTLNMLKIFDFENHEPSKITIYDYYRSNIKSQYNYNLDRNADSCKKTEIGKELNTEKTKAEEIQQEAKETITKLDGSSSELTKAQNNAPKVLKIIEDTQKEVDQANTMATEIYNAGLEASNNVDEALNATTIAEPSHDSNDDTEQAEEEPGIIASDEMSWEPKGNYTSADDVRKDNAEAYRRYTAAQNKVKTIKANIKEIEENLNKTKNGVETANEAIKAAQTKLKTAQQDAQEPLKEAEALKKTSLKSINSVADINTISNIMKTEINEIHEIITAQHARINQALKNVTFLTTNVRTTQNNLQSLINSIKYEQNQGMKQRKAPELKSRFISIQTSFQALVVEFDDGNKRVTAITSSTTTLLNNFEQNGNKATDLNKKAKEFIEDVRNENQEALKAKTNSRKLKNEVARTQQELQKAQKQRKEAEKAKLDADKEARKFNKLLANAKNAEKDAEANQEEAFKTYKKLFDIMQNFSTTKKPDSAKDTVATEPTTTSVAASTDGQAKVDDEDLATQSTNQNEASQSNAVESNITTTTVAATTVAATITETSTLHQISSTTLTPVKSTKKPEGGSASLAINDDHNSKENCAKWYRFCDFGL
ncbi:unnamed protein product [Chironomus riparius]|uniref:Uncharacterized protein n=1 Tax=Chironomus riparius TaxID=315576 RepID=A0A9N9S6G8_9DIPT|nr:unnamed protein product [Chironomus riparius]